MPILTDLPRLAVTRRSLITAAIGLGAGSAAAGGLAAAEMFIPAPALTIVGQDAAQFTLLRAADVKIGLLFGIPAKAVLAAIGPMLGWTSPRLDLLVISPAALNSASKEWLSRTTSVRSLLVLGPIMPGQMPSTRRGVAARVVTEPATIPLGSETQLDLLPAFSTAAVLGAADTVAALALVRRGAQTIAVVDDAAALQQQPWKGGLTLLVTPGSELRAVVASRRPAAIAVNGGETGADQIIPADLALPGGKLAVLRTYLTDPAVIELHRDEVRLPGWTITVGPGAGSP